MAREELGGQQLATEDEIRNVRAQVSRMVIDRMIPMGHDNAPPENGGGDGALLQSPETPLDPDGVAMRLGQFATGQTAASQQAEARLRRVREAAAA